MKLKRVFQKLTGMELLMDSECDLLLESMPKTEEECATYSILTIEMIIMFMVPMVMMIIDTLVDVGF